MLKNFIRKIDETFLGKSLQRQYGHYMTARAQRVLETDFDYRIVSYYQKDKSCELLRLCDVYGSDKGELREEGHPYPWPSHTFADYYSRLFSHCRENVRNVFECGLGTNNPDLLSSMGVSGKPGASLRIWRDYFPNAMIYGADIDESILFQEDRIRTFYIDQLDPTAIENFWRKVGISGFDFIIDDGLHTFEGGSTLFLHSVDRLAANGIYIIEDVGAADLLRYKEFFGSRDFVVEYVCLFRPNVALLDNSLVVVRKSNRT